jgi:AcrR family transcriptional regulator
MNTAHRPPARRLQAERSAASTEAMLSAAIELILDQGARVSMMAIGQRSGFSHGLVLARFGSKAGLIKAVTREVQHRFVEGVTSASQGAKGLTSLLGLVDAFFAALGERSTIGRAFYVLLGESLGPDPHLRAAFVRADEAFRHYVQRMLEEAQATGEVDSSVSAPATAILLVGMLRGVAMQYCVNPAAFETDDVRAQARALVERLRAPGSQSNGKALRRPRAAKAARG